MSGILEESTGPGNFNSDGGKMKVEEVDRGFQFLYDFPPA